MNLSIIIWILYWFLVVKKNKENCSITSKISVKDIICRKADTFYI